MRNIRSLRLQSTLVICALILAVVVTFAATAYLQLRRAAMEGAAAQLTAAAGQLAPAIAGWADRMAEATGAQARDPALANHLLAPDSATRAAALEALRPVDDMDAVLGVELRDAAGSRALAFGDGLPATDAEPMGGRLPEPRAGGRAVVGPLGIFQESPVVALVAPVVRDGNRVGTIVRWVNLSLSQVISTGAGFYLGNASGDLWTNLDRRVDPPALDLSSLPPAGPGPARDAGGTVVAGALVPGTPWAVAVSVSHALVLGGPQRTVGRMLLLGLLIMAAAAGAAWLLSGRLTGRVAELGAAARAITAGDYAHRTPLTGDDEIGVLGKAFNTMASSVAEAHQQLQQKISELAESEAQNRRTRKRMEHVISSSGAILYTYRIADREVVLEWVSESVNRLLGYTVADVKAPGLWRKLRHPEDRDRFREAQRRLQDEGKVTLEYRLRHADGQYRWVRDEQRLLRDDDGEPREVVGVLSDVSEHRRLAGEKEAAEAANLAKSEFLSRMSHELRTPLNSVLGFGQLLQLDVESEEQRESVSQILKAGQHLLSLIDEVLDVARIESGQLSLSVEPVSVAAVVRESLDLVRLLAAEQGITIRAHEALACEHYVRADQQRLKQVLLNLLSNAIKYNRLQGSVTVTCEAAPDDHLRIVVADTGFGMSPKQLERLFTPFERLDAEQAGVEGTGLGLALSLGLMEAMGGELGVSSDPGRGTRFWVELSRTEPPMLAEPAAGRVPTIEVTPIGQMTHTVLFIEDNLANVRLVERLFQRRPQIRLLTAMQGSLGVQLAREQLPDLVLLDLNLPDMPGDVVLRNLRQDPDLRDVPVVMISGDAIPSQVQRVLDLGADAYITKPFDIQELLSLIDDKLQEKARA